MTHWTISVGSEDETDGISVSSYEGIRSAVAGVLMGGGLNCTMAKTFGSTAVSMARVQQENRRLNHSVPPLKYQHRMADGRVLTVRSDDLPEDPAQYCGELTDTGSRCPRHLNHLGECR